MSSFQGAACSLCVNITAFHYHFVSLHHWPLWVNRHFPLEDNLYTTSCTSCHAAVPLKNISKKNMLQGRVTLLDIKHSRSGLVFFRPQWRMICNLWARIFQKLRVPTRSQQQKPQQSGPAASMLNFSWVKLEMPHMWELRNWICLAKMQQFCVQTLLF